MRDVEMLRSVCYEVVHDPGLQPLIENGEVVETHCNAAAERVAQRMGCEELDNLMAEQQHEVMRANVTKRWAKVDGMTASAHANAGGLAFASATAEMLCARHGHIAALTPEPMEYSGSLGKDVPMVANVGKQDADEKESQAFPVAYGEPDYFIWD